MILVFVPGAGCTGAAFREQAPAFPGSLVLDPHAAAPEAATVAEYAGALRAELDALDEPFVLAGSSMGAAIALEIAIGGHPGLAALVALGCGPRLRVAPAIFERIESDFDTFAREMPEAYFVAPSAGLAAAAEADLHAVGAARTLADFRACDRWDATERCAAIGVPVLVLTGERDVLTPPRFGAALADRIPGGALRILPGAGHLAMLEFPAATNDALRSFVIAS